MHSRVPGFQNGLQGRAAVRTYCTGTPICWKVRKSAARPVTLRTAFIMSVLAGCDYLGSLPGMGIKKAYAIVKGNETIEKARFFFVMQVTPGR